MEAISAIRGVVLVVAMVVMTHTALIAPISLLALLCSTALSTKILWNSGASGLQLLGLWDSRSLTLWALGLKDLGL